MQKFEKKMDDYEQRMMEKIQKASFKELSNMPYFKANRQRIYDDALNLAKSKKGNSHKFSPKFIEFRVHYITNVT